MSHLCEQSYWVLDSKGGNLRASQHLEHSELSVNLSVCVSNYKTTTTTKKSKFGKKLFSFWKYISSKRQLYIKENINWKSVFCNCHSNNNHKKFLNIILKLQRKCLWGIDIHAAFKRALNKLLIIENVFFKDKVRKLFN